MVQSHSIVRHRYNDINRSQSRPKVKYCDRSIATQLAAGQTNCGKMIEQADRCQASHCYNEEQGDHMEDRSKTQQEQICISQVNNQNTKINKNKPTQPPKKQYQPTATPKSYLTECDD